MTQLVPRSDDDGLCTLTLNRPESLNALNPALFVELRGHVDALAGQADSIGCVILCGNGRSFSAGRSPLRMQEQLPGALTFVRLDRRLAEAAELESLRVLS